MSMWPTALIYTAMCVFDVVVLGGTAYLIGWHDWSSWWMLLAVLIACGSNPKYLIATASGDPAAESPK